jgi:hypothetical protein
MKYTRHRCAFIVSALALAAAATASADTVSLQAKKDTTLYSEADNSNGGGQHLFVGTTDHGGGAYRRILISFDVAASIPAGSTIQSASLTLHLSKLGTQGGVQVHLHRDLAGWGEGTTIAGGQEGRGGTAASGDATWNYNFFDTSAWTTPGGDFAPASSADIFVSPTIGFYTWNSTAALVADVQSWLDSAQTNFGWVVRAEQEGVAMGTAKRFDSRQNINATFRPALTITYTLPVIDAGMDGGEPDAAIDSGTDSGMGDSGSPDGGSGDGGQDSGASDSGQSGNPSSSPQPMTSGCQTAPGSLVAIAAVALFALSRARRSRYVEF